MASESAAAASVESGPAASTIDESTTDVESLAESGGVSVRGSPHAATPIMRLRSMPAIRILDGSEPVLRGCDESRSFPGMVTMLSRIFERKCR